MYTLNDLSQDEDLRVLTEFAAAYTKCFARDPGDELNPQDILTFSGHRDWVLFKYNDPHATYWMSLDLTPDPLTGSVEKGLLENVCKQKKHVDGGPTKCPTCLQTIFSAVKAYAAGKNITSIVLTVEKKDNNDKLVDFYSKKRVSRELAKMMKTFT